MICSITHHLCDIPEKKWRCDVTFVAVVRYIDRKQNKTSDFEDRNTIY